MLGDFNSRFQEASKIVGPYGDPVINDNDHRLIEMCKTYNLKKWNGSFKVKYIHRQTWIHNTRTIRSIIDYFIRRQKSQLRRNDVRVLQEITCGLDHFTRAKLVFPYRNNDLEATDNVETNVETI